MALTVLELKTLIRGMTLYRLDETRIHALLHAKVTSLWEETAWSFRQGEALLTTVVPYTTGTVTLNADPTKVDGSGTAWDQTMVGRKLHVGSGLDDPYYTVVAVTGQQLTLDVAFIGTVFSGSTYQLVQTLYTLDPACDKILSIVQGNWPLLQWSVRKVDVVDTRRTFTSSQPVAFVPRGENSDGTMVVEISPVPASAVGIHYVFQKRTPLLTDSIRLPFGFNWLAYLVVADGLLILAGEKPAEAAAMINLSASYEKKGLVGKEMYLYQDEQKVGVQAAVHDEAEESWRGDDWAWSHDTGLASF